jgi:hypothetical protein
MNERHLQYSACVRGFFNFRAIKKHNRKPFFNGGKRVALVLWRVKVPGAS